MANDLGSSEWVGRSRHHGFRLPYVQRQAGRGALPWAARIKWLGAMLYLGRVASEADARLLSRAIVDVRARVDVMARQRIVPHAEFAAMVKERCPALVQPGEVAGVAAATAAPKRGDDAGETAQGRDGPNGPRYRPLYPFVQFNPKGGGKLAWSCRVKWGSGLLYVGRVRDETAAAALSRAVVDVRAIARDMTAAEFRAAVKERCPALILPGEACD